MTTGAVANAASTLSAGKYDATTAVMGNPLSSRSWRSACAADLHASVAKIRLRFVDNFVEQMLVSYFQCRTHEFV